MSSFVSRAHATIAACGALGSVLHMVPRTVIAQTPPPPVVRDAAFWEQDTATIRHAFADKLEQALLRQRAAWQRSEIDEHGEHLGREESEPRLQRAAMLHCHPDGKYSPGPTPRVRARLDRPDLLEKDPLVPYPISTIVRSANHKHAACPNWVPERPRGKDGATHEYTGHLKTPAQLVPFPSALLTGLDSATQRFPENPWSLGQLVRVALENGDAALATRAIARCVSGDVWCTMVRGFVLYTIGDGAQADSVFQTVVARVPAATRCRWQSLQPLYTGMDSTSFTQLSCPAQEAVSRTLWWLAMPFWTESGNLRRAAHYARFVQNAIIMGLPLDAVTDLRRSYGSDAVVAMRTRYGWAPHIVWGGSRFENAESEYILNGNRGPVSQPVSAPEYSRLNVSTVPPLQYGFEPLGVTDDDFLLGPPPGSMAASWWPAEFFLHPSGTILRITDAQRAFVRRDTSSIVLMATIPRTRIDISMAALANDSALSVDATLVFSPQPDVVQTLDQRVARSGERVVLHGEIPGPGLVGFEYRVNANNVAGGRSRFGVPAPLSTAQLPPATCALSDLMLVDAAALTGAGMADAYRGLLPSLTLSRPTTIGVIWESYEFSAADSVAIAVRVGSDEQLTRLRQLGMTLGVADDPRTHVSILWQEVPNTSNAVAVPARVSTHTRQLMVNVATLRAGEYRLEIVMRSKRCGEVSSARRITIAR